MCPRICQPGLKPELLICEACEKKNSVKSGYGHQDADLAVVNLIHVTCANWHFTGKHLRTFGIYIVY